MKLTLKERRALQEYQKPFDIRDTRSIHANTRHALERKKLIVRGSRPYQLTKLGCEELKLRRPTAPDIFDDLFRGTKP